MVIMEKIIEKLQELVTTKGLEVVAAIVILVVGAWVAKIIKKFMAKILHKRNVEGTIVSFVCNLAYVGLMVFVIIAAINKLGYDTTSFAAVIAAAGLAIGLAMQGSLSNFAAGFLLIIFKPFKKGDYIEGAGTAGIVKELHIFTTTLNTPDNKKVIIPNAKLTGDIITNYSANDTRRVEIIAGVSYSDDLDKVKSVLQNVAQNHELVLDDPAPQIAVKEMADSSVNFVFRVWVKTSDYWTVFFDCTETIKKRFDAENITIPFPQRDVHMFQPQ
jgi:small conductance mechanosensitive channel